LRVLGGGNLEYHDFFIDIQKVYAKMKFVEARDFSKKKGVLAKEE